MYTYIERHLISILLRRISCDVQKKTQKTKKNAENENNFVFSHVTRESRSNMRRTKEEKKKKLLTFLWPR